MLHRRSSRILSKAALACCLLASASSLSACGGLEALGAFQPPPADRPCDLPNQEKAGELAPQGDLSAPLQGDDWVRLQTGDAAAYNLLYPRYNANIDFARERCVAKKGSAAPAQ